ncbi:MAG: FAD-binding protein [Bifidobacteriaceae bacterium]|jgi:glycolate oxidase|nr:FAD-binding protein [Bifidobacteriaceae bacterium]
MNTLAEHDTLTAGLAPSASEAALLDQLAAALPPEALSARPEELSFLATDATGLLGERPPVAAVFPSTVEQVQTVLALANNLGVPVVARGAGTGLAGGAVPKAGGIVLSLERLDQIIDISPQDHSIRVQAGVITAQVSEAAAQFGLFYAPDPASADISSVGGNIATNAGGFHCAKYGVTRDSVLSLKVVLADGALLDTGPATFKNSAGLSLTSLFIGSEGTLGVIVEATLRLRPAPAETATFAAFFPSLRSGIAAAAAVVASPVQPAVLELLRRPEQLTADAVYGAAAAAAEVLVLGQTDGVGAHAEAETLYELLRQAGGTVFALDAAESERFFDLRRGGRRRGEGVKDRGGRGPRPDPSRFGDADVAVPPSRLVELIEASSRIAAEHGLSYNATAHAADGNVHTFFFADGQWVDAAAATALNQARTELYEVVWRLGGTITGEHGIGLKLAAYAEQQLGSVATRVNAGIKQVLDPVGILNPGKWI